MDVSTTFYLIRVLINNIFKVISTIYDAKFDTFCKIYTNLMHSYRVSLLKSRSISKKDIFDK